MVSAPLIIGHRGASHVAPENTLDSFARALADGADGVEFDVRLSRDHIPVVIHDETLKRTGRLNRAVCELSATELQRCNVSVQFNERSQGKPIYTEGVPALAQVLELLKPTKGISYLEMKPNLAVARLMAEKVVEEINAAKLSKMVIVSSFDLNEMELIKQIDPSIRTAALFEPRLSRPLSTIRRQKMIDLALAHGADEIALHHSLLSPRVIESARQRDMPVVVWTVDDASWVERACAMGIKALITNDPALLVNRRNSIQNQTRTNMPR